MTEKASDFDGSFSVHLCGHCSLIHFTIRNTRREVELSFGMNDTDARKLAKDLQNLLYAKVADK